MKITAEKKCSVRIEGDGIVVGDKYVVIKTNDDGKPKKVAIVLIKKTSGTKAIGTVTAGAKNCGTLLGASVEALEANSTAKVGTYLKSDVSKFEANIEGGFVSLASTGIHQAPTQIVPSLQLWSLGATLEAFPLLFLGSGSVHKGLGVSLLYSRASPVRDIEVNTADSNPDKKGKQNTVTQHMQIDSVFRLGFAGNKASTELHPIGFVRKTLVHTLSGGSASRSPLRNISYQGFTVGAKQRYFVMPNLRATVGLSYCVGLSGVIDDTTESTIDPVLLLQTAKAKSPSAWTAETGVDFFLRSLKVTAGIRFSQFSSTVELQSSQLLNVKESHLNLYTGVGVAL